MNSLSVIVPASDGRPTVERVTAAIRRAEAAPDELIVVDEPVGLGAAAARNRGARRATGDILVFVDADVEVHADAFKRIRTAFDENPTLAAVFGSYDDDPDADGLVSEFRNLLHHHVHQQGAGVAPTFWTGLGAIRRDLFVELGGFDEDIAFMEDIELGGRLNRRGAAVLLDPAVQGKHLKRWTLVTMTKTDLLHRGVPWLQLILEGRTGATALNLGWRHRMSTLLTLVVCWGLVRRRWVVVAASQSALVALDAEFYGLLLRRGGIRLALAGIPLHAVHRLTSVAAVPLALAAHIRRGRRG